MGGRVTRVDANEFAAQYREYLPRVLNFIRLRVPDEMVAQDLTAMTFEQAFRKVHQLRSEAAFGGWLFQIARNQVGQYYRRRRVDVSLDALVELPLRGESPAEAATRREELAEVLAAIAELPEREQEIIALKYAGGLSNREIARATGLSDSNVGVILFRALRKLRVQLGAGPAPAEDEP